MRAWPGLQRTGRRGRLGHGHVGLPAQVEAVVGDVRPVAEERKAGQLRRRDGVGGGEGLAVEGGVGRDLLAVLTRQVEAQLAADRRRVRW